MDEPREIVDLLHALGFLYLRHGQPYRAVMLLIIAAQTGRDRPDVLRTLALALIESGMGDQALEVLTRLGTLDVAGSVHPMMRLMRARALLLTGRREAAQAEFQAREAA